LNERAAHKENRMRMTSTFLPYLLFLSVVQGAIGVQAQAVEKLPKPGGIEVLEEKLSEARAFVVGLGCVGAIPRLRPEEYLSLDIVKWPLTHDQSLSYPLQIMVQANPINKEHGHLIALIEQVNSRSLWEIVDVWIESNKGEKVRALSIPSKEIQGEVNARLPRLLMEKSVFGCEKNATNKRPVGRL